MSLLPRALSSLCLLPLLWLAAVASAAPITIDNVRAWRSPDQTRIVFDVSGVPAFQVLPDVAPGRVVVDFRDAQLKTDLDAVDLKDGPVRRLRSGLQPDGTLRVVMDLGGKVRVNGFALAPGGQYGHRLVVDLYDEAAPEAAAPAVPAAGAPAATPAPARPGPAAQPPLQAAPEVARKVVVALDAGHGGEDPGAIGPAKTREKDVVLAIARATHELMKDDPGMHPVLVRTGDYYIGLRQRRDIARKRHNADIFVSIHADAFHRREARGASVFAVSRRGATSTLAAYLADRENRADLVGGVDPRTQDDVMNVISDLMLEGTMSHSLHVGSSVLAELGSFARLHKPRVEQAGFMVLKEPNMPSILVETGFISNPEEERLLRSVAYQQKLARALASGVRRYFERFPPPGTWFAAHREGRVVAATTPVTRSDAVPEPEPAPARAKPPARPAAAHVEHKVRSGQSLGYLAQKYGVSQAAIKRANNLRRDTLYVGETLKIPRP